MDPSLTNYDDFVLRTNQAFARMTAARTMSSDDVAKVIYEAEPDGMERLRYLAGTMPAASLRPKEKCPIRTTSTSFAHSSRSSSRYRSF